MDDDVGPLDAAEEALDMVLVLLAVVDPKEFLQAGHGCAIPFPTCFLTN